jgi:hypothetical protein
MAPMAHGNVYVCQIQGSKNYHNKMCSGVSKSTKGIKQVSNYGAKKWEKGNVGIVIEIS